MSTASDRRRRWHPLGALCAVCRRPARGFGWADPAHAARPRPAVWFCSIACQDLWWRLAQRSPAMMVDLTDQEQAAVAAAVKSVAEIMQEIGWSTRFQDLTKEQ